MTDSNWKMLVDELKFMLMSMMGKVKAELNSFLLSTKIVLT